MFKEKILENLKEIINKEISQIKSASKTLKDLAHSDDMKQEGKYDTRATETQYLAAGQERRLYELQEELELLNKTPVKNFGPSDEIGLGALVEIELNKQVRTYFISTTGAGTMIKTDEGTVLVISVFSPIGDAVLGLKVNDEFELETPKETRLYKVKSVQ